MGLSTAEIVKLSSKTLSADVISNALNKQWWEEIFRWRKATPAEDVLTQFNLVLPAPSLATAQANAAAASTIIQDLSQPGSAIRLTEVPGSGKTTYASYSVFGNTQSPVLGLWIQPQAVPQANNQPSIGYSYSVYDGNPASGGTLLSTTEGMTGVGISGTPGLVFNYSSGLLIVSRDFGTVTGRTSPDFYVTGFRYIGQTLVAGSGGGGGAALNDLPFGLTQQITISNLSNLPTVHVYDEGLQVNPSLFNKGPFNNQLFNQQSELANCELTPLTECYFPGRKEYVITLPTATKGRVVIVGSSTTPSVSFIPIPPPSNLVFVNGDNIIFNNADNVITVR